MNDISSKLLSEIENPLLFCENSLFSFCIDNNLNIAIVTNILNGLIDENKVVKFYFSVKEERMSAAPIGTESFPVYKSKSPEMTDVDINGLMD